MSRQSVSSFTTHTKNRPKKEQILFQAKNNNTFCHYFHLMAIKSPVSLVAAVASNFSSLMTLTVSNQSIIFKLKNFVK